MEKITFGNLDNKLKRDIIAIIIGGAMVVYMVLDLFWFQPTMDVKVKKVTTEFIQLKTYLDAKLPQIDSVLVLHTNQIQEQTEQLNKLNELKQILNK